MKNIIYSTSKSCRASGSFRHVGLLATSSLALLCHVSFGQVTMTAGDAFGESSFVNGTHWSDGLAPSSGKDYSTSYLMRTPQGSADNTSFAGDSLTLQSGGQIAIKNSAGVTITAPLIMDGGAVNTAGFAYTLDGTIELAQQSKLYGYTGLFTILSEISGDNSAQLRIAGVGLSGPDETGGVVLANGNNSYAGGTLVENRASLFVSADGALGASNIELTYQSTLTLSGGVTNDYIDNSAFLIIRSDSNGVNLDYSGTDTIGGLSLDSGSTFLDAGTYGAVGSGAEFEYSIFSGTGTLTVIPESSNSGFLMGAIVLLLLVFKARKSRD